MPDLLHPHPNPRRVLRAMLVRPRESPMILPLLLILGMGLAAYQLGRTPASPKQVSPGVRSAGMVRVPPRQPQSYVRALQTCLRSGQSPSRWLVNEALREAYSAGRPDVVSKILLLTRAAGPVPAEVPPARAPGAAVAEGTPAVTGTTGLTSPFEDVEGQDWSDFARAMRIGESQNARYAGPYQHNKDRLEERGLDPSGDPDHNFRADVQALDEENVHLIRDFAGEVIEMDGQPVAVTRSGVLALLKAAGPEGAHSWLTEPEDRKKFPHTTDHFVRGNGCF